MKTVELKQIENTANPTGIDFYGKSKSFLVHIFKQIETGKYICEISIFIFSFKIDLTEIIDKIFKHKQKHNE